jgi:hypothetical protein
LGRLARVAIESLMQTLQSTKGSVARLVSRPPLNASIVTRHSDNNHL